MNKSNALNSLIFLTSCLLHRANCYNILSWLFLVWLLVTCVCLPCLLIFFHWKILAPLSIVVIVFPNQMAHELLLVCPFQCLKELQSTAVFKFIESRIFFITRMKIQGRSCHLSLLAWDLKKNAQLFYTVSHYLRVDHRNGQ